MEYSQLTLLFEKLLRTESLSDSEQSALSSLDPDVSKVHDIAKKILEFDANPNPGGADEILGLISNTSFDSFWQTIATFATSHLLLKASSSTSSSRRTYLDLTVKIARRFIDDGIPLPSSLVAAFKSLKPTHSPITDLLMRNPPPLTPALRVRQITPPEPLPPKRARK
ncbi:hypothetical protein HY990_03685 [Candidatus Micrarchaeota archaeon]|nr:hypothetical protein [Candidatus Micrarchaeota archaeon]